MSKTLARRGFLRLAALAPVAAREAAAKMGLSPATSLSGGIGLPGASLSGESAGGDAWIKRALDAFGTARKAREINSRARAEARMLDPDLASMRSVSAAAAYTIQRSRCFRRIEAAERQWLSDRLEDQASRRLGL